MMPTAQDVAEFLGQGSNAELLALAEQHLPFVEQTVRGYTRERGFDRTTGEPSEDLALVIVASCARLVVNPALHRSETIGTYTANYAGFIGWTLPERAILDRYRKKAL